MDGIDRYERQASAHSDDRSDAESADESQDASSAAEPVVVAKGEVPAQLRDAVLHASAELRKVGALVKQLVRDKLINDPDQLASFNQLVVREFKHGSMKSTFEASNNAQIDLIVAEIYGLKDTDTWGAIKKFTDFTDSHDALAIQNVVTLRTAIATAFYKREDEKARSATVVRKPEGKPKGERTGQGRGRGGVSKPEATEPSQARKFDRSRGHGPHKGGDCAPAHESTHETSRGPTRKPREPREARPPVGLGKSVAS